MFCVYDIDRQRLDKEGEKHRQKAKYKANLKRI